MQVRAEVVDPELLRPRCLVCCRFAVEEEDVRFDTLRVEDAGGKAKERVDIGLLEQLAANRFAGAAFEENVVRNDHRGPAVLLEDREDVLDEVELLVAGGRPEII